MGIHLHVVILLLLLVPLSCVQSSSLDRFTKVFHRNPLQDNVCEEVPQKELRQVLGSAFNEYYMSFIPPEETPFAKRGLDDDRYMDDRPFYFEEHTEIVVSEDPAWNFDFTEDHQAPVRGISSSVEKRTLHEETKARHISDGILDAVGLSGNVNFRWHCNAPKKWIDLGKNYFPRYILSVDCNHADCQGPRIRCEPLSFGVKVLRRREGVCSPWFQPHKDTVQIGVDQMPLDLRRKWVWETRVVRFCCVCRLR